MGNLIGTRKDELKGEIGALRTEMTNLIVELEQKLRKERRFETGTLYRPLGLMWNFESCDFLDAADEWKKCRKKDKEAIKYYKNPTARGDDEVRYYSNKFVQSLLFPGERQSMAHLIPSDPSCSLAWLRALSIVTDIDIEQGQCPLFCEDLRNFVEGKSGVEATGKNVPLKAWNWNFLKLPEDHQKHFDGVDKNGKEQLIVTPSWDPNEEWKPGTGYKLMVAASPETYKWLLGPEIESLEDGFGWLGEASPGELEKATDFLRLTVKALADLLYKFGKIDMGTLIDQHADRMKKANEEEKKAEEKKKKAEGNAAPPESENPGQTETAPEPTEEAAEPTKKAAEQTEKAEEQTETSLEQVFKAIEGAIPRDLLSQRSFHGSASASGSTAKTGAKKVSDFIKKITAVNKVRTKNLITEYENETTGGNDEKRHVQIPVLSTSRKPVLVVDLGLYFKGMEHLIPDPFLVVLKAAVALSGYKDQKLLPACGKASSRHRRSGLDEESIPLEIFAYGAEDMSGDDDSSMSISEVLTGPPGDGNFEEMRTVSPCGKTTVKVAMVTP